MSKAKKLKRPKRRKLVRVITELHHQIRTRGESPSKTGWAIGVGTFVSCIPLYGAHLIILIVIAKLFKINLVKAYLAAHLNNPITAPPLLYLQYGIGYWLLKGGWPVMSQFEIGSLEYWLKSGGQLLLGSLIVGIILGALLGFIAYRIAYKYRISTTEVKLREATCKRYLDSGIFNWEYVRGLLKHDAFYFALLKSGLLPQQGVMLDVGCGRGVLLSLLITAKKRFKKGWWDADWPAPPQQLRWIGIEDYPRSLEIAGHAVGNQVELIDAPLLEAEYPNSDVVVILQALSRLDYQEQERLVDKACEALNPGGLLILRAGETVSSTASIWGRIRHGISKRLTKRPKPKPKKERHSLESWMEYIERKGLTVQANALSWKGDKSLPVLVARRELQEAQTAGERG